jgi:hypothetical protein
MSADVKKGYGSTMILMILGILALYGGAVWLLALVPVALLLWHAAAREFQQKPEPTRYER